MRLLGRAKTIDEKDVVHKQPQDGSQVHSPHSDPSFFFFQRPAQNGISFLEKNIVNDVRVVTWASSACTGLRFYIFILDMLERNEACVTSQIKEDFTTIPGMEDVLDI